MKRITVSMTVGLCLLCLLASCTDSKEKSQRELMDAGVISSVLDVGSPVGEAALLQAIAQNNEAIARKLLEAGVSPNASVAGVPALLAAINKEETALALHLLELGADVNASGPEGATPLMEAAFGGKKDLVAALLARQADAKAEDDDGWTPLMCACAKSGKTAEMVEELLNGIGLDESNQRFRGSYGLRKSPKTEPKVRRDIVQMLLEAGAENSVARYGLTPLAVAACEGRTQMVKQLAVLPTLQTERALIPPMVAAVWGGEEKTIKALMAAKADMNADYYGCTPLSTAVKKKHAALIPQLVAAGAEVNRMQGVDSPLFLAVKQQDIDCVKALVEAGAELNPATEHGLTPLSTAMVFYQPEIVDYLLEKGANPQDPHALETAVTWERKECFLRLLKPSAAAYAKEKGKSVIEMLVDSFNHSMEDMMRSSGSKLHIHTPAPEVLLEMLDEALMSGLDVNALNTKGETPLHVVLGPFHRKHIDAATRRKVLIRLLEAGASPNIPDGKGHYPLASVVSSMSIATDVEPFIEEAALLLQHGADPDVSNGEDTLLHKMLAPFSMKADKRCRMVRLLVESGADVNAKEHDTLQVPLQVVFRRYHRDSAELLGLTQILADAGASLTVTDKAGKTPVDTLELYISLMKRPDADKVIEMLKKSKR